MKIIRKPGNYDLVIDKTEHLVFFLKESDGDLYTNIHLKDGAKLQMEQIILGGNHNCKLNFTLEKDAELNLNVATKLNKTDSLNYCYFADHLGENSKSDLKIFGSLNDSAQKTSELKIHFAKGAVAAFGSESEKINLFSSKAKNCATPTICSDESEAQGRHSFSSGHISEDEFNYLQTRGIDSDKIKVLLAKNDLLRVAKLTKQADIIEEIYEY